jgi:iron(III) transport system substrate-binding protein
MNRRQALDRRRFSALTAAGVSALALNHTGALAQSATPEATPQVGGKLTIYCGRNQSLVSNLIPLMQAATGIELEVRYGNTAELAAAIMEEGSGTPAGLFFCQDAGALGALAKAGVLAELPADMLEKVDPKFRSPAGLWIGLSGRVRVLLYNPEVTDPATLPAHIIDLPKATLNGPVAWAPSNAPFQSFITALRFTYGEDAARQWLVDLMDAGSVIFEDNGPQIAAVASQEVAVGLVNHYYLYEAREETPGISLENYYFPDGDIGGLVNVGGAGVIAGSGQEPQALAALWYLLGEEAQTYFAEETLEYPLAAGVPAVAELVPLSEIQAPDLDLGDLDDLEGTLALLTDLGLI